MCYYYDIEKNIERLVVAAWYDLPWSSEKVGPEFGHGELKNYTPHHPWGCRYL